MIVLAATVCFSSVGRAKTLRSPVDVLQQRSLYGERLTSTSCPKPVGLPRQLVAVQTYIDPPVNSRVDPEKVRQAYALVAPVREVESVISHRLGDFVRSATADAAPFGDCVLRHVMRFAEDNAMVETTEWRSTGLVRLMATTAPFAYMVLRNHYPIASQQAAPIESWIRRLADRITFYQKTRPYGNTNIELWGAAAQAASAVALQDTKLLDTALRVATSAIDRVTPDGTLEAEMARGDRALQYSLFAMQALAVIVAVTEANGMSAFTQRNNHAVIRLMRTNARAVVRPESFIALSGNPAAAAPERVDAQDLGWTALRNFWPEIPEMREAFCRHRSHYSFRAGGDWNYYFAGPGDCKR